MAEDKPEPDSLEGLTELNLNDLSSLSLGPNWSTGKPAPQSFKDYKEEGGGDRRRSGGPRQRDRRSQRPPRSRSGPGDGAVGGGGGYRPQRGQGDRPPQGERRRGDHHDGRGRPGDNRGAHGEQRHEGRGPRRGRDGDRRREAAPERPFQPVVEVTFYPEETPFKALSQAIKTSLRTFELFEVARLILQKPERFVVLVKPFAKNPEEPGRFFASVPDGLPFFTEEEALNHVFANHLTQFFTIEETEGEPPKGNFTLVNRCGITGELLGPPNYHRYQALLQEHHAQRLAHVPFERFTQRIESVREREVIDEWVEKMRKIRRYKLIESPEGEETVFDNSESARYHLITHAKEKLVRPAFSARFEGKTLERLAPGDPIRRSVEAVLEHQLQFPLDTANHLRGRLRRMNFAVYKKGSKGISYVCAVKRRTRVQGQPFSENIENLLSFLEDHPNFPRTQLVKEYLGIILPEAKPAEAPVGSKSEAASGDVSETEAAPTAKTSSTEDKSETSDPAASVEPEASETANSEDSSSAPAASAEAATVQVTPEDAAQIRQLQTDLRWLVEQGYVIEYSDGKLLAPPAVAPEQAKKEKPEKESKPKAQTASEAKEETATEASTDSAEPSATVSESPSPEEKTTVSADASVTPETKQPEVEKPEAEASAPEPETVPASDPDGEEPVVSTPDAETAPVSKPLAEETAGQTTDTNPEEETPSVETTEEPKAEKPADVPEPKVDDPTTSDQAETDKTS